jgi:hypothetical protein
MLVQTAIVIPLSVGRWGPREGDAPWAFAAARFWAAAGVGVTTLDAVLALGVVVPGAVLPVVDTDGRIRGREPARAPEPIRAGPERITLEAMRG